MQTMLVLIMLQSGPGLYIPMPDRATCLEAVAQARAEFNPGHAYCTAKGGPIVPAKGGPIVPPKGDPIVPPRFFVPSTPGRDCFVVVPGLACVEDHTGAGRGGSPLLR
jgi:hypothetical protein